MHYNYFFRVDGKFARLQLGGLGYLFGFTGLNNTLTTVGSLAVGMPQHDSPVTCNMRTARGLTDARTVTHSTPKTPPKHSSIIQTKPPSIASMAAVQDMEHQQMSLNSCVDGL